MAAALLAGAAYSSVICPTNFGGITGSATGFCVDSYGQSAYWSTDPNQNFTTTLGTDLLGQSGLYIAYTYNNTNYQEWIGSSVGGSTPFLVEGPVLVSNNQATSDIADKGNHGGFAVEITIVSQVIRNNIEMVLTIKNVAPNPITGLTVAEYLQYFPSGRQNENAGAMYYEPVSTIEQTWVAGLWAEGDAGASAGTIRAGGVCGGFGAGCATPASYAIGDAATVESDIGALKPGGGSGSPSTGSGSPITSPTAGGLAGG